MSNRVTRPVGSEGPLAASRSKSLKIRVVIPAEDRALTASNATKKAGALRTKMSDQQVALSGVVVEQVGDVDDDVERAWDYWPTGDARDASSRPSKTVTTPVPTLSAKKFEALFGVRAE